MLPEKILLATDGSQEAARAAQTAAELAEKTGAELHVVHVGHMPDVFYEAPGGWMLDWELVEKMRENAREEAAKRLKEWVREVAGPGRTVVQTHAKVGRPEAEIVQLAEELDADLVVVGSRGLGRLRRALMGSVSESVLHYAHCSVLVARGTPLSFPVKILTAVDGSQEAARAAQTAAELAEKTGSELHVVHVGVLEPVYHPERHGYPAYRERIEEEVLRLLEEQVERLKKTGKEVVRSHPRLGRADEEILAVAGEIGAELIVTGNRGLSPLKRVLMGSVSDSVVRHARCPVLVVRGR